MAADIATVTQHIPSTGAGTDDEWYLPWPHAGTWIVDYVVFTPATAVAIDGTDYVTLTVSVNASAASTSWSTLATHNTNTGGTAFVLGTAIQPTVTPRRIGQGWQIRFITVGTASGQIVDGTYTIQARKVN